jgi:hypothetical protein
MILNTISLLYKARPKRKSHVNIKEALIGQDLPLCKEEEGQCLLIINGHENIVTQQSKDSEVNSIISRKLHLYFKLH